MALGLLAIYVFAQPWSERGYVSDVEAATIPAWHFVETGSMELTEFKDLNPWFVETSLGIRSNRSPGIIGFAILAYGATKPFTDGFENWPGIVMAVLVSWLAVLFVAATAERMRAGLWLVAVILFGLGTATWGVSAGQLNPHGSAQLAIAIGLWFLLRRKDLPAGLAMAVAVLVRPLVVILGIGLGVAKAVWDRSLRPLFTISLPSLFAGILYLTYNRILFGSWSPSAAYEAAGGFILVDNRLQNIVAAFISPRHGVFIWSAWLAVGVVLLVARRKQLPEYAWLVPLVAGIYMVIHSAIEISGGGLPYNYRYPLEPVTFAAPLLLFLLPDGPASKIGRFSLIAAGAVSLTIQAMFVITSRCGFYPSNPEVFVCYLFG
ncbi:MAG: hypothetical protein IH943_04205 [Acidobacteria bacterium]|nr:hypothetical protein [Acidobacteriota bacterium]